MALKTAMDHNTRVTRSDEAGFTLLETAISMVLLAIIGLGIASVFFFAARNNVSAGDRQLAMAVAQQRMEQLRNVSFTDANLTATSTAGTTTNITRAGRSYVVLTRIEDTASVNGNLVTKKLTVKVTPWSDGSRWSQTVSSVFGSVTMISVRTAQTMGPNRQL